MTANPRTPAMVRRDVEGKQPAIRMALAAARAADPVAIASVTGLVALALRLAHVLVAARAIVMGDSIGFEIHARNFLRTWQAIGTAESSRGSSTPSTTPPCRGSPTPPCSRWCTSSRAPRCSSYKPSPVLLPSASLP